jgi:hypothetical protein
MRISDTMVYLTDNGAALCGQHLGMTARFTGRDISGQPILPLTPEILLAEFGGTGVEPACETCGRRPGAASSST